MKLIPIVSGSSLVNESRACVGWPFTSLMPNISEDGNCAVTFTASVGEVLGFSTSSSACENYQQVGDVALGKSTNILCKRSERS